MSKRMNTSWIIYQNNKRRAWYSILGMIGLSLLYFYLCTDTMECNDGIIMDWIGGTKNQLYTISKLMIKVSYLCLVFLYVGKLIEDMTASFTYYLAPRYGNRKQLITKFAHAIMLHGIIVAFICQIVFAIVGILYLRESSWLLNHLEEYCSYIVIECVSIAGMIVINIILNTFLRVEHSSFYIMVLYIAHSVIPKNFPIATTLCKLGQIYLDGETVCFEIQVLVTTVLLYVIFRCLLRTSKE